ncbi:MAG: SNF2-related protein, partial [Planctomycetota bacterium]|nr:SNF2-related protein [Planctomycetota bacterium]
MWNRHLSLASNRNVLNAAEPTLRAELNPLAGFDTQADDLPPLETITLDCGKLEAKSIPIRVSAIKATASGFLFPESKQTLPPRIPSSEAPSKKSRRVSSSKRHRIQPPKDIVKLQDRLYYLLQPPLDLLVGSGQLNFPFEPFPYQLDGIAFLFPRYAAVLADEMGLGKTMQAISTIRLLLCSGEVRSVLLVCPKPLVTNWLREFSVWAPEIPIAAIEGNAAKREFQWRSAEIPVKVANYELLMRDKEIVLESGLHFDLVALDEAQRIKNRNST